MRPNPSPFRLVPALLVLLLSPSVALADAAGTGSDPWTLNLYLENDLFGDTDQDYTNGIRFSWVSPDLESFQDRTLPHWVREANQEVESLLGFPSGLTQNLVISFGQLMYTPEDITTSRLLEDQRPYAGHLYLGLGYHARTRDRLHSMELTLGVVGPASQAQKIQNIVHDLQDIDRARGWRNQLRNEPTLQLVYEHKQRLFSEPVLGNLEHDFISHGGGSLGNVRTYLNVGGEYRLGWDLPEDFGTSAVRPAGDNSAPGRRDPRLNDNGRLFRGLHGFISFDGRAVLHDIFLDGNSWRNSHSVDKEHFVADIAVGFSFLMGRWKFSYAQVFRTREFKKQPHSHEYGSLAISYTW